MTLYCGVDFHSRRQTVCYCDTNSGEIKIKELHHYEDDLRAFYEQFKTEPQVIVGDETSGYSRWFEKLLFELGYEVWAGDATQIARLGKRRQKNDRRDSEHILDLMLKGEFPRLWRTTEKNVEILRLFRLLRFLLGEAAHQAARRDDELKLFFQRIKTRRGAAKAATATAGKLLIRLFIMLRDEIDYAEFRHRGVEARSSARLIHRLGNGNFDV